MNKAKMILILLAAPLILAGCNQDDAANKELFISAAASLSTVIHELVSAFGQEHGEIDVKLNFGSSGKLAQQIEQGAPVDLFLSAEQKAMDELAAKNLLLSETRVNFTKNKLVLIAKKDAALQLSSLTNLHEINFDQISLGHPDSVPAGAFAKAALLKTDLWNKALEKQIVYAKDVSQVLAYVESGNTDLGFVYLSDLRRSDKVKPLVEIDGSLTGPIVYPAAVVAKSKKQNEAKAFIAFLESEKARAIFKKHGFGHGSS